MTGFESIVNGTFSASSLTKVLLAGAFEAACLKDAATSAALLSSSFSALFDRMKFLPDFVYLHLLYGEEKRGK